MKKALMIVLSFTLAFVLALSLTACGGGTDRIATETTNRTTPQGEDDEWLDVATAKFMFDGALAGQLVGYFNCGFIVFGGAPFAYIRQNVKGYNNAIKSFVKNHGVWVQDMQAMAVELGLSISTDKAVMDELAKLVAQEEAEW